MITTLMRQDPAARNVPVFVVVGLVAGLFMRGFATRLPDDLSMMGGNARGWLTFGVAVVWISCLMIALSVNFMTRSSRLAMALPIQARTVWWSRMISILYSGSIPVLLATLVVSVRIVPGVGWTLEPELLVLGGKAWAGMVLAIALFQTPRPALQRIRAGVAYVGYVVVLAFVVMVLVVALPPSPVSILVLLAPAVALLLRLHFAVPEAFLLVATELEEPDWLPSATEGSPTEPSGRPAGTAAASAPPVAPPTGREVIPHEGTFGERRITHLTLFRLLVNHWQTWLIAPLIAFYAFLLGDAYYGGRDPFPNLLFITVWPLILTYQGIIRLSRVDHLPVARGTLCLYIILPGLVSSLIGVGFSTVFGLPTQDGPCQVCYGTKGLQVPPEHWEIAWDGHPPRIDSPWGESLTPMAYTALPGTDIAVYLPFATTGEHSDRFLALQANRAVEAVHGSAPFRVEEIADNPDNPLVETMARRDAYPKGFPIRASIGRGAPVKQRAWLLGALGVGGLWTLLTVLLFLRYRPSAYRSVYVALYYVTISVWAGSLLVYILGDLLGYFDPTMSSRFFYVLLRQLAESVPLGAPALVLLNLLALGIGCLLIQAAFRGIEAPLGKIKPVWKEYG